MPLDGFDRMTVADNSPAHPELLHQIAKLSKITRLISEGHYFLYYPNSEALNGSLNALAENFNFMVRKLREAHENFENRVEQRTSELRETTNELKMLLNEVSKLKNRQDADYYLASLLLDSFGSNRCESENIKIEFLVEQEKRFTFRGHARSIGGDLCGAYSIVLSGRKYAVFVNADAMGKSIQGAAGALVLGAVFGAIVQRTRLSEAVSDRPPELWLRDAFTEIQKVFESFDGKMLIALFIGLVDEETGLLYYVNADFPFPVLYRKGSAQYINSSLHLHKVGVDIVSLKLGDEVLVPLRIQTFQLEDGDVLISGSDGRDDLAANRIEEGVKGEFIESVNESRGDLGALRSHLESRGAFMDDLSLMRLQFIHRSRLRHRANEKIVSLVSKYNKANGANDQLGTLLEIYSSGFSHPDVIRKIGTLYFKSGNFKKALEFGISYHSVNPADSRILLLVARAFEAEGDVRQAFIWGERCRLRDPENPQVLSLMIALYRRMGQREHADYLARLKASLASRNARGTANSLRMREL